jgi:glutathione peroxidase
MKKKVALLLMASTVFLACTSAINANEFKVEKTQAKAEINDGIEDLYAIKINSLAGEAIQLSKFKGKKILFVNVASKCGYTPQYADLQKLHELHQDKLVIIGVPCNQFGGQEPGNANEIESFCQKNYGVDFLMTEKIDVKGDHQHPLYTWLTSGEKNGVKSSKVKWNFQKYLVDEEGKLLDVFMSNVKPLSKAIVEQL